MKNSFKYIFSLVLMFIVFVPSYKAADSYMFYCNYDVVVFKGTSGKSSQPEQTFPLRVQVYKDGNSKFYSEGTELINNRTTTNELGVSGSYPILFDSRDYYKEATKNDEYVCPPISVDISSYNSVNLKYYGSIDTNDIIPAIKKTDLPVVNPYLSTAEKEEINSKIDKVTRECNIAYDASVKNFPLRFPIVLKKYKSGKNSIQIGTSMEEVYDNNKDVIFNMGDYTLFIYSGEADVLFGGRCPSKGNFYSREAINSTATSPMFFITTKKSVADESGKGETGEIVDSLPGSSINGNFELSVGSEIGTCVDYLGSAETDPDSIASLLDTVYTIIKIGSIVAVIVFSMLDFAKTVSHSKDDLMDSVKKCVKRLVVLVIILLLPTFIDLLGELFGIEDVLCGIK